MASRRLAAAHLILIKQVARQPLPVTAEAWPSAASSIAPSPRWRAAFLPCGSPTAALPALGAVMKGRAPAETTLTRIG